MRNGDPGPAAPSRGAADLDRPGGPTPDALPRVIETVVCPFHCLYQDALHFHTQSQLRLPRSESEASRLARAALLLYVAAAEALAHQAAEELGHPDLARLVADPGRPLPLFDTLRSLPAAVAEGSCAAIDPDLPPWPQFAELLALRTSWAYPGPAAGRRAYYLAPRDGGDFEPLQPHQIPPGLGVAADSLLFPLTGLPRDPYALRPRHLDTARGVLDATIAAIDRRLGGAITQGNRHRREPTRYVTPG